MSLSRRTAAFAYFIAPLIILLVSARSAGAVPPGIDAVDREDLAHAYDLMGGSCAFSLVAASPDYAAFLDAPLTERPWVVLPRTRGLTRDLRARLAPEAARISGEVFPRYSQIMLANRFGPQKHWPTTTEFADTFEEVSGYEPLVRLLREGLLVEPPREPDEASTYSQFQRLLYLLKITNVPKFLLNRGLFGTRGEMSHYNSRGLHSFNDGNTSWQHQGRKVFFSDNVFWGAEVGYGEFRRHEKELLENPTLQHLNVWITPTDLPYLLRSPVMRKLTSLRIDFIPGRRRIGTDRESTVEYAQIIDKIGQFSNLRRLTLDSDFDYALSGSQLMHFFRSASELRYLRISGAEADFERPLPFLSKLEELAITEVIAPGRARAEVANRTRTALQHFFAKINPALKSLQWSFFSGAEYPADDTIGDVLGAAPEFTSLEKLDITTAEMSREQWRKLVDKTSLWKNLRSLHYYNPRETGTAEWVGRAIAKCDRLSDLGLSLAFTDADVIPLFRNFRSPILNLELPDSTLSAAGVQRLAAVRALSSVQRLRLQTTRPSVEAASALLAGMPELRDVSLLWPTNELGRTFNESTLTDRQREAVEALRSRGVRIHWQEVVM